MTTNTEIKTLADDLPPLPKPDRMIWLEHAQMEVPAFFTGTVMEFVRAARELDRGLDAAIIKELAQCRASDPNWKRGPGYSYGKWMTVNVPMELYKRIAAAAQQGENVQQAMDTIDANRLRRMEAEKKD
jgi:hypothetical protein